MSFEYVFLLGLILLTVWFNYHSGTSVITKKTFVLTVMLMIAMAGLRNESVGRDYTVYREYFELGPVIGRGSFISDWIKTLVNVDIGWVFLGSLIKTIGLPFEVMIFLIATLAVGLSAKFYFDHSKFYALALLIYFSHAFFYREMIQIRTGLACALLLWSYFYLAKRHFVRSCLVLLMACSIHLSAFLVIIPMVLYALGLRPGMKTVLMLLLGAVIISQFLNPSLPVFGLLDRLAVYQGSEYANSLGIFTNPVTVKQITILLFTWWLVQARGVDTLSPVFILCLTSYLVSTIWIISFKEFEILGARGASFLSMGEPIILAEAVAMVSENPSISRFRRLAKLTAIGFALTMFVLNIQIKKVVDEYHTIFQ